MADPNQKLYEEVPKPVPMDDRGDGDKVSEFDYELNMALLDAEVADKQRGRDYAKVGYSKIKSGFRR